MRKRKIFLLWMTILLIATSLVWAVSPVMAAGPPEGKGNNGGLNYKGKITIEERLAAGKKFRETFTAALAAGEFTVLPAAAGDAWDAYHVVGADGRPVPHYFGPFPNYALSELPVVDPATGQVAPGTGIRKFIDSLPGLGAANANNLGQYLPVAVPDTTTYPDADYYEIALVEYRQKMHTDIEPTTLRGYVQLDTDVLPGEGVPLTAPDGNPIMMPDGSQAMGVDTPHYLGPVIEARKDRPVRVKFYNLLPTGEGGDLFIPVDTTVMGAGMGPVMGEDYTQNRATIHLHGGRTPWISDGTPFQWITPANENTPYPKGVSVYNVPDMPDPGPGAMTFFYTNQQSARFMFYHDHAMGITRLNVYVGEAAGYLIRDEVEEDLIARGIIPSDEIPLVIQDKTFVPDNNGPFEALGNTWDSQMYFYDPTWDYTRWGGPGGLWFPHVYMPVQNPYDISGYNAFGRWHYGPWFWPPVVAEVGPQPNPYYDGINPLEPPEIPGVPSDSMGMESFFDTPVVNGTAYPYLEVDPKAYRFRILNAANDRFWNLQLYEADPDVVTPDGRNNTEVRMVPIAEGGFFPAYEMGVPDPTLKGPQMIQIGNEGGFLPSPVVLDNQHISWNLDQATFNFGNVDGGNLILGPAERADVIVDFSDFAGKTLILYNDSPAPFPAWAPQFDYFTGAPDNTDTGGSPGTLPGYGPNTRTIMQIRVADAAPAEPYDLAALEAEFDNTDRDGDGQADPSVFQKSQHEIIVGQPAYNDAYGMTFPQTYSTIFANTLSFTTPSGQTVNSFPMEAKAIQDEMGEAFDKVYGRMSGFLGLELPQTVAGVQNFVLSPYLSPPVEIISNSVYGTQIASLEDGTQIWKITHNGVDTHPIHFHLFEVQLINRVGWDNGVRLPDPNELGWKETIRISPLEDTIVALRPVSPTYPFDIPNSIRLIDPTRPEGAVLADSTGAEAAGKAPQAFAPNGEPIDIINHYVNFGWEYVWHCHILSHEEMDMMHAIAFAIPPAAPGDLTAVRVGSGNNRRVNLSWTDNSLNETRWVVQRSTTTAGPWTDIAAIPTATANLKGGTVTYTDRIGNTSQVFYYRVFASNVVGDTWDYTDPNLNEGASFPTITRNSGFSNVATFVTVLPPPAPTITGITAVRAGGPNDRITITWTDVAGETGYTIQRATNDQFSGNVVTSNVGANNTTYTTGNVPRGQTFWFRIAATNEAGASAWSNVVFVTTP